jgi:hypothetical protein
MLRVNHLNGFGGRRAGVASIPSVLLVHCDGADASTTFTDVYGNAITAVGNAQVDTALTDPFGGNAGVLLLDGSGDYLSLADSADWDFSADFTIECWVRLAGAALSGGFDPCFLSGTTTAGGSNEWYFNYNTSTSRVVFGNTTVGDIASSAGALSTATWYHLCAQRTGSTTKVSVDGTWGSGATNSSSHVGDGLFIGAIRSSGGYINGAMDEIRITKGTGRYTIGANFTRPSAAFTE